MKLNAYRPSDQAGLAFGSIHYINLDAIEDKAQRQQVINEITQGLGKGLDPTSGNFIGYSLDKRPFIADHIVIYTPDENDADDTKAQKNKLILEALTPILAKLKLDAQKLYRQFSSQPDERKFSFEHYEFATLRRPPWMYPAAWYVRQNAHYNKKEGHFSYMES